MRADREIWRFTLIVLALLTPCFVAWYWLSSALTRPAAWLAFQFARVYRDELVIAYAIDGRNVVFDTSVVVHQANGVAARVLADSNPLLFTAGTAFFLALMLASRARLWHIALGVVALVPFQAWGLAFDVLSQLAVRMGPDIAHLAKLDGWRRELAALGYQLGTLIFPPLVPILLWAAFEPKTVRLLVGPPRKAGRSSLSATTSAGG